jgi:hypothetical protein
MGAQSGRLAGQRARRAPSAYQLETGPLMDLRDWLGPYERFWREHLAALHGVLEDL